MNKLFIVLAIALGGAVIAAYVYQRDMQIERGRADALAARVAELEPVERSSDSNSGRANEGSSSSTPFDERVERAGQLPVTRVEPQATEVVKTYSGSVRARRQVERLQSALENGTPLQEYQIRALITALDQVWRELEQEKKAAPTAIPTDDHSAQARDRMVQTASDILFESQLETFIELLARDVEDGTSR
jgi:hypothetical protein